MAISWYESIFNGLEKYLKLKIPFEVIYFPSSGISSALSRYASQHSDKNLKLLIIDLRAGLFSEDKEANKMEFLRMLQSHLEQSLDVMLEEFNEKNTYRLIEKAFKQILDKGENILVVIEISAKSSPYVMPDLRDFLVYMDRLRNQTEGRVNILLTTTQPLFNEDDPAPIPMISHYYNYYNPEKVFTTLNQEIFLKDTPEEIVRYMFNQTGGMASILKSIQRDLEFYHLKPEAFINRPVDAQFFNDFLNLKIRLDRTRMQLHPRVIRTLNKIAAKADLNQEEAEIRDIYLTKTGILDEDKNIRGSILNEYFKLYGDTPKRPNEIIIDATKFSGKTTTEITNYVAILRNDVKVHTISGQIWLNGKNGSYLSEKELKIFNILYANRGSEISRDQIAKAIWNEDESYSDWALDKLISRIREKLGDKRPYSIIHTNRKVGFSLN